ncbi:hypothetical protein MS2017_0165 [Bathymodiolus thermophilus thioautotrophic gill symbiont]|uniref:Colicin V production protein n=1 Tax=Bathymodiolus thermophilus thioautotrophic gill symbiont TaxID=2360 RepID=A0A3G3IJK2_9GAMM|nr:CvpA family protein [Bathymodiolus thermophilus thioautotrophic gill symbiont]AYQ55921.1 hypothetical protein MS2017_0165 [Bathymodiolus thermophilus thioautotrophic gill symbiont]
MSEFFTNISNLLAQVDWSSWVTVVTLLGFSALGFKRGMAKELIYSGFTIFGLIMAWWFYQDLASNPLMIKMGLSAKATMAIAFGAIFISIHLAKEFLYLLVAKASTIIDPCVLNKSFLLGILLVSAIGLSCYVDIFANFNVVQEAIANKYLRIGLSSTMIFIAIISVSSVILKLSNTVIHSVSPCILQHPISGILSALRFINNKLNATHIHSTNNNIGGAVVGLIKGILFIVIVVLILQNTNAISLQLFWIESQGALRVLQEIAINIQPKLAQYLIFLK